MLDSVTSLTLTGVIFFINVSGAQIQAKVWKNAEAEPPTFQLTQAAVSTSGRVYLSANGGSDTLADDARFDNIQISGATTIPTRL